MPHAQTISTLRDAKRSRSGALFRDFDRCRDYAAAGKSGATPAISASK
jgi:hypothetical protein